MFLINESSRTDARAGPPARNRVATAPSESSLRTHFQPDITIVEVGGVVDAGNVERPSDYVADLASHGRPVIPVDQSTKTPPPRWCLDAPWANAMRPPRVVTQPRMPIAWRALDAEPRTVKGPLDAGVIT
jgi:hypothetical protein